MNSTTDEEDTPLSLRLALKLSTLPSEQFDQVLASLAALPFDIWDDDAAMDPTVVLNELSTRLARMTPRDKYETAFHFVEEFQQMGDLSSLEQAIRLMKDAYTGYTQAEDAKGRSETLRALIPLLSTRFQRTDDLNSLSAAIDFAQQAVNLDMADADKAELLYTLGQLLLDRFSSSQEKDDLNGSLQSFIQGLILLPDEDNHVPLLMGKIIVTVEKMLGNSQLLSVYNQFKADLFDSEEGHFSLTASKRAQILHRVGSVLLGRFEFKGAGDDLEEAIILLQHATMLDPTDPGIMSAYGVSRIIRFEQRGFMEDLTTALASQRKAAQLLDSTDEREPGVLNNLGNALQLHSEESGKITELDEAVTVHLRAAYHFKAEKEKKFTYHYSLAKGYHRRFERLQDMADLNLAVDGMGKAVDSLPENHPAEAQTLASYGGALVELYSYTYHQPYLDQSIKVQRKAIVLTPSGHPARPIRLINLAQTLTRQPPVTTDMQTIDEAIQFAEEGLLTLGEDRSASQAVALFSLSVALRRRYQVTSKANVESFQSTEDLDRVIDTGRRAIQTLQLELQMGRFCSEFAISLLMRYRHSAEPLESDRDEAIAVLKKGSSFPSKPVEAQFLCAIQWAQLCVEFHGLQAGLSAFKDVFKLIPRVVWIGSSLHRRYEDTQKIRLFLSEAVALALKADDVKLALEWAEEGRCVVWGQIIQLRQSSDNHADKMIREEMEEIKSKLQDMGMESRRPSANPTLVTGLLAAMAMAVIPKDEPVPIPGISREEYGQRLAAFAAAIQESKQQEHRKLAERYDTLVREAQVQSESNAVLPQSKRFSDLHTATKSGPVVFINVCDSRCDAIAIVPWQIQPLVVHLDNFSQEQAEQMLSTFITDLEEKGVRNKSRGFSTSTVTGRLRTLLASLWTDIVYPVLLAFGDKLQRTEDGRLPHITWCPSGPLTFLPLHAAGIFKTTGGVRLFDIAVSSYTPTISALLVAQASSNVARFDAGPPQILAVSQPNTPEMEALPSTVKEIEVLQSMHPDLTWLNDTAGTKDAVLEAMKEHEWVHLACHGIQDLENPLQSAFVLQDKSLELADLMRQSFTHTQLAYLSACRTAAGNKGLPEEAVHLAAGMLMAGFQNVVATLWAIGDEDATFVAEQFYGYLKEKGGGRSSESSYALHYAVGKLREEIGVKNFLRWIPFIHFGM